jgi:hypothetical protein
MGRGWVYPLLFLWLLAEKKLRGAIMSIQGALTLIVIGLIFGLLIGYAIAMADVNKRFGGR